jgi:hypothetical protein
MKNNNFLTLSLKAFLMLDIHPNQKKFFKWQIKSAKPCKIKCYNGTFITEPIKHGCYRNAALFAIEKKCDYVEGFINCHGIPISHAWNYINNKHIDITLSDEMEYVEIARFSHKEIEDLVLKKERCGEFMYLKYEAQNAKVNSRSIKRNLYRDDIKVHSRRNRKA